MISIVSKLTNLDRWSNSRNPIDRNRFRINRRAGDECFCYQLDESNLVPVFERNVIKANCSRGNGEQRGALLARKHRHLSTQGGRYTLETRTFATFSKLPIRNSTCLPTNFVISLSRQNLLRFVLINARSRAPCLNKLDIRTDSALCDELCRWFKI